ncbi:chorismate mutase aro7 [Kappamyces sp. JEL0829]|nr:chorismate mutase aro7 [Kappamyces sp. JEL0829]KAJ3368006.1 chorismate mutase aro7 [Kappamyces sp. JEL0680]
MRVLLTTRGLEDTIIFGFIERSQFAHNPEVYQKNGVQGLPDDMASFLHFYLHEMECVHAKVRRYTSPDEYPFTKNLPEPVLPPLEYPKILHPNNVIVNDEILRVYVSDIVPAMCKIGSDGNYGSSATKDMDILQSLSRRIHFGKFVAEAKFNDPALHDRYVELIKARDREGIMTLLTNKAVEQKLLRRLRRKALIYGQEIDDSGENLDGDGGKYVVTPRIQTTMIASIYEQFVIPLTKEVEVEYLLQRLS